MQLDRRTVPWAVGALVAAILADLAEVIVDPAPSGTAAQLVNAAAQDHARMVAAAIFLLASSAFIVPAAFGLVPTLRDHGRSIGRLAMALALLAALGHAALAALYLAFAALPGSGVSRAPLIAVIGAVNESSATALLFPLIMAFPLSLIALFVAMVRGRRAPRWVLVPVVAAPLAAIVAGSQHVVGTGVALACFLVAACALAARPWPATHGQRHVSPAAS